MSEARTQLRLAVGEVPGIHFNGLVRRLDLAPGQAQHHLRRLVSDGEVERLAIYGRTHYFQPGTDPSRRRRIAVCHRETARELLVYLLEAGRSDPASAAEALGVARSTLEWHLGHLVEQDLVEKRRDGRGRVELVPARPAETVRLLRAIEPSLPDRLVDRFTRLIDHLLAE